MVRLDFASENVFAIESARTGFDSIDILSDLLMTRSKIADPDSERSRHGTVRACKCLCQAESVRADSDFSRFSICTSPSS